MRVSSLSLCRTRRSLLSLKFPLPRSLYLESGALLTDELIEVGRYGPAAAYGWAGRCESRGITPVSLEPIDQPTAQIFTMRQAIGIPLKANRAGDPQ